MGATTTIVAVALTLLITVGSILGSLVVSVHTVVGFSRERTGSSWNFTVANHAVVVSPGFSTAIEQAAAQNREFITLAGHGPEPILSSEPEEELQRCAPMSIVDIYVINMDDMPQRYSEFMTHMTSLCGVNIERVHRHSGIVASASLIEEDWVRELIPGVKGEAMARLGSLGLALAHLTVWEKIGKSESCQLEGAEDAYALVFEDDERPRSFFADAVNQVLRVVQRFPKGTRPDIVNLNVKRPSGRMVATLKYPQHMYVLEVPQKARDWRTGPLCGTLHCNVWMSAYMVRCGGIQNLIHYGGRYPDGAHIYNGVTPTFDRQMADVQSDGRAPVKGWSVSPENIISFHREGFDARKKRDAEAAQHALAQGFKKVILNSKEYVHEELDEAFDGFEWH